MMLVSTFVIQLYSNKGNNCDIAYTVCARNVQEIVKLCIKTVVTMNRSFDSQRETLIQ